MDLENGDFDSISSLFKICVFSAFVIIFLLISPRIIHFLYIGLYKKFYPIEYEKWMCKLKKNEKKLMKKAENEAKQILDARRAEDERKLTKRLYNGML